MSRVAFLTDVEGNLEHLLSFVHASEALRLLSPSPLADGAFELALSDGWAFVFGGDAVDKGGAVGGSIRVVRTLIRLKRIYPDRVTLLIGNRDANKIRITSELTEAQLAHSRLASTPGPYWVPEQKRVSPAAYLANSHANARPAGAPPPTAAELCAVNTLANRIRWMLKETMGADGEFERRRRELAALGYGAVDEDDPDYVEMPTDADVCDSFINSVAEGGFMRELLLLGQLAIIIGPNLFVHGGLCNPHVADGRPLGALGHVPGHDALIEDVGEWVDALNMWYREQVAEWIAKPCWADDDRTMDKTSRGGHGLIDYVVPTDQPTVVLARHLTPGGMPLPPSELLMRQLNSSGITRLLVGHTPHGNCPTVIKAGGPYLTEPVLEIVMADTSYSDMKAEDNRGAAVSEVQLLPDGSARVHGVLGDGTRLDYVLAPGVGPEEELVGRLQPAEPSTDPAAPPAPAKAFVKAWLPDLCVYLFCSVDGFKTEYTTHGLEHSAALVRGGSQPGKSPGRVPFLRFHSAGDEVLIGAALGETDHKVKLVDYLFKMLDTNSDGTICIEELRLALESANEILKLLPGSGNAPWTADELIQRMDRDGGGTVSRREFRAFVLNQIAHSDRSTPVTTPMASRQPSLAHDHLTHDTTTSPRHAPSEHRLSLSSPLARQSTVRADGKPCPLGLLAEPATLKRLPSVSFLAEPLDDDDMAEVATALGRAKQPSNIAFLSALATSGFTAGVASVATAAAEVSSVATAAADVAEMQRMLTSARRPATIRLLAAALGARPTGGGASLAELAVGITPKRPTAEANRDLEEVRRLLGVSSRERSRGVLRLISAQLAAEAVRTSSAGTGQPTRLPPMESTVLLLHPAVMRDAALRVATALTGQASALGGFAPPLDGGSLYRWIVVNRYYRAHLNLLVLCDSAEAHSRLHELAAQAGALMIMFDASRVDGWLEVQSKWGGDFGCADEAPDVFLLLADGGSGGDAALDFSLSAGAELVEIDSAAGSVDMAALEPLAAKSRGEAVAADVDLSIEWEGLPRVLEAVQCRRWPTHDEPAGPADPPAIAVVTTEEHADMGALKRHDEVVPRRPKEAWVNCEPAGETDARADAYMAELAEEEPREVDDEAEEAAHKENEALEKLIAEVSAMRQSGSSLPDGERRERAAKLALEMSRMLGEASASDTSDADGA